MKACAELIQFFPRELIRECPSGRGSHSFRGLGGSGFPDSFGESVLFRPYAGELFDLEFWPQLQVYVAPLNGLAIRLWVNDRNKVEDGVVVGSLEALDRTHFLGVRISRG